MNMNPVVHFSMPYDDSNRMADFYARAFGWSVQFLGEDMGNYALATTSEPDDQGRPKKPGMINGGFYKKSDDPLSHCMGIVIAVDNLEESMQSIKEVGGTVMSDSEIPNVGRYASVVDTEGNRIGILQPNMK